MINLRPWLWSIVVFLGAYTIGVHAEIPNDLEPDYADAVISFHTDNHEKSLLILKQLLEHIPLSTEVLELKALNLRSLKRDAEAFKVYKDLVDLKSKQGRPKKEIAPYTFELGMIRFNNKEYEKAISFFQFSEKEEFNLEVSKFYLANCYFMLKKDEVARKYFEEVVALNLSEIKPAAQFYLAQIYFRADKQAKALDRLFQAKEVSRSLIDRGELPESSKTIARQIDAAVDAILKPLDKNQWFGSASFMASYDSNVLLLPNESSSDTSSSGLSSAKGAISLGFGYATSAMKPSQYIPNARFSTSRNTNNSTHSGEYLDSAVGLMYNRNPIATRGWGLRTELENLSQSQATTIGGFKYGAFDKSFGLGPNYHQELGENWSGSVDYYPKYTKYSFDSTLSDEQKRSGILHALRVVLVNQNHRTIWNPTVTGKFDFSNTHGTEYRNIAFGATLANVHTLKSWSISESLDLTRTTYAKSSTDRKDNTWVISLGGARKLSQKTQLITGVDYTKNSSTDSTTYSYHRFSVSAGVSFSL